ncbi:hypothetical protein [Arthrobacter woluwensis]|uniref:hypothetical protein n=1 Tax=Arthrobacter woluwensis TaxID=156980 RepID=UPI003803D482
MEKVIVFAASQQDAAEFMQENGLDFESTVWVMNVQLLGAGDYSDHTARFTDTFRLMPAYGEAAERFGEGVSDGV